jgi:hypothetical protein
VALHNNVGSLFSLLTLLDLEAHPLSLDKRLEAGLPNFGKVREQVLAPVVLNNEPKAFRLVEPKHRPLWHDTSGFARSGRD